MDSNKQFKANLAQTRAYLVLHDPAFAQLLAYVLYKYNPDISWGCTDGKTVELGSEWLEASLPTQAALLVHEILHVAFRHVQLARQCVDPAHYEVWNILNDAIINSIIQEESYLTLPEGGINAGDVLLGLDVEGPLEKWSSLSLYHEWLKQLGGKNYDSHLEKLIDKWLKVGLNDLEMNADPSRSEQDVDQDLDAEHRMSEEIQARLWNQRIENYNRDSSSRLKRTAKWVEPTKYPWKSVVFSKASSICRRTFRRTYESISLYQKINPASRIALPSYRPQRKKKGIYIAMDTSGSISESDLSSMLGVANSIQSTLSAEVYLMFFDRIVQDVVCVKESVKTDFEENKLNLVGGGGTAFEPIFEYLDDKPPVKPQVLFVLTDGYGSFPSNAPEYPVVWVLTSKVRVPFGNIVPVSI